ncbi:MAG TPA: SDR family NAD(P)-dependent oxidoreductase [Thermoanaerobaculia bacterium]|nr:SDR family NAD(P)-dependent oxidoreductase [Thermoanaerobaculia bacterium]
MTVASSGSDPISGAVTLCEVLRRRAAAGPDWPAYTFLLDGEAEEARLTCGELDRRARAVAARLQEQGGQGERVLLLYPPGLEYVTAVFGCFYAGALPILAFPPRLNRPTPRVQAIVADAQPKIALTQSSIIATLRDRFTHAPGLASLDWLASDAVDAGEAEAWREPRLTPESLAFLQYTSGSTGTPKGVMVSHGNVMHNLELLRRGFAIVDGQDRSALWLPIYHDMGLVGGILEAVYSGMAATLMSPAAFLQRPVRWLQAITRHGTTISGGPNFAYQLCADQITPEQRESLDLSRWRSAFCGAEPIHARTLERFAEVFAPCGFDRRAFFPCYGMAETTLIVSGGPVGIGAVVQTVDKGELEKGRIADAGDPEAGRPLVGSGQVLPGLDVVIADPETGARCAPGTVGEIWIAGPSVAQGYWNRPEETQATFQAYLTDGGGPFLRTGDLGYLHEGELFVTGRSKDLIIIRGQNHYPQDVERTVEGSHAALRAASGAAFSVEAGGEERLVVVQEVKRESRRADKEEVFAAIRAAVAEQHDLAVHAIVLLQPASIPKTSSGKIRRHACRAEFLAGGLERLAEWRRDDSTPVAREGAAARPAFPAALSPAAAELAAWLTARLAEKLGIDPQEIDAREPFARYGLDSARAMALAGDLEVHLGRRLEPTLLYEHPTVEALVRHLVEGDAAPEPARSGPGIAGEPVAIVGIGCRFPGADGPEAFWKLLRDGVDAISEVPAERWDLARFYDPDPEAPGKISTRWGGFLEGVDGFDLHFFGLTQREAARTDPQQRLLLETAWEALEDAGQVPERLAGSRTGVFVGISTNDYGRLQWSDPELIDIYGSTGNAFSIAANRLSYTFDFRGPSIAVDTACSSSLVSVYLACRSLESGECDLALAAGVNVILSPAVAMSYTKAGAMAKDGRCKAFDAAADGFVRGEGAGCVVLKPLSRALADGDPVYAVIRGSAVNQDGRTNGLMAPSRQAQEAVLREAYARAGLAPGDVHYVEAHGTGTLLGDPIEARALGAVLGEGRPADQPCALGSVKTNIGHLEAAAGIAGLIKTALSLHHRQVPPSLHFHAPNPHIPFAELPLAVQRELAPWPVDGEPARAGVSAFGFGGTNAHVVLEESPVRRQEKEEEGAAVLLPLSARSAEALAARARALRDRAQAGAIDSLADLSFTSGARRAHHDHRLAVVCRDRAELIDRLTGFLRGEPRPGLASGHAAALIPTPVFVYSGQGSQWWGMGRELMAAEPVFRAALEEVAAALAPCVEWSLLDELAAGEERSRLAETEIAQPALFAVQVALTALWRHWGVEPGGVMGHSSGEVAAAWAAGVLTLEEAARWVAERGRRLQGATGQGRMAMVSLPAEEARQALTGYEDRLAVAAVNSPSSTVLSGEGAALDEVTAALQGRGVFCRPLRVDYAFHSPQVEPYLEGIEEWLAGENGVRPKPAAIPLVSTLTGKSATGRDWDAAYWRAQVRQPVAFAAAVATWLERGMSTFLEIGPHPVLTADLAECLRRGSERGGTVLASLRRGEGERASLLSTLGALYVQGQPVAWDRLAAEGARCVPLPSYPWQRERCWLEVPAGGGGGWDRPGAAGGNGASHPLLGHRLPLAHLREESVWDNELAVRRLPYLKDHRVEGSVVLPATAYVDMALSAADAAGVETGGLAEVRFRSPLLLPDEGGRQVQAVFSQDGGEDPTFRIFSRPLQSADTTAAAWTLHASGRVLPALNGNGHGNGNGAGEDGIAEIRRRCRDELTAEDYYAHLHGRGLQYGPAFQGITRLFRGRGEALGHVQVPASLASGLGAYQVHPAILDACGQVLIAAEGDKVVGGGRSFLPMEIGELKVHGRPGMTMWSHARLHDFGAPDADSLVGDARLLDEDGQVVIEALGLRLRYLEGAGGAARRRVPGPEDWLYELCWEQAIAEAPAAADLAGVWLLLADSSGQSTGVAAGLAARIGEAGGRAVHVVPGAAYQRLGDDRVQIRPAETADVQQLFADVVTPGTLLRGVVHLWALDGAARPVTAASLQAGEPRGCGTVLPLVRELAGRPWNDVPRLWVVTRGAQPVVEGETVDLSQATLWGLGRTVGQEQPAVWGGLIDLDRTDPSDPSDRSAAAHRLLNRLARFDGETQVAFRGGRTHVARIARARHLSRPAAPLRWRPDASYLVTGGLGGLGLEVARWMVAQGARRLVLLGRTQLPPRPQWSEVDPASRVYRQIAAIRELEALGASVHLASVDVADEAQVAAFLDGFRREGWPAIRGVVHAAGVLQDQTILELDARGLDAVFRAKVLGAWLLHRLLAGTPLDFFVLFSSAASLLGSAGQANYAAANGFLDSLAHHRRAAGEPALAINWGPWAEVGMAAEDARRGQRLAVRGIGSIPPEQGLEVLEQLLRGAGTQVGVLPIQWAQLFQVLPQTRTSPLLSELAREVQESEVVDGEVAAKRRVVRDYLQAAPPGELTARLESLLAEQVAGVVGLPASRLDTHVPLNTLGIDSLLAVELKNRVENEMGVVIPAVKLLEGPSIADLATVLRDQVGSSSGLVDVKAGAAAAGGRMPVTPIQPKGTRPPFLCIHPGALDVHCYDELARALGEDQPFFALTPPELDNYRSLEGGAGHETPLEDVAAACAEAIRAVQPHGPYYLGGWSMGGILAFLAAQQLQREGEEIALLAAFDSPAPPTGEQRVDHDDRDLIAVFTSFLGARRGQELPLSPGELAGLDLDAGFALLLERAKEARVVPPDSGQSQIRFLFQVFKNGLLAAVRQLGACRPPVFLGALTLFRVSRVLDSFDEIFPDITGQWSRFTAEPLKVHEVPGDHYTMFSPPNVQVLAAGLGQELAAAQAAREGKGE